LDNTKQKKDEKFHYCSDECIDLASVKNTKFKKD
jgi:hypothetical protein